MASYTGWKQKQEAMQLPMMTTFTTHEREDGKFVAHALDFDIVSVAETRDAALFKARVEVQLYVEYGFRQGWQDDIVFKAPQECWDRLTRDCPLALMDPIEIRGYDRILYANAVELPREAPSTVC